MIKTGGAFLPPTMWCCWSEMTMTPKMICSPILQQADSPRTLEIGMKGTSVDNSSTLTAIRWHYTSGDCNRIRICWQSLSADCYNVGSSLILCEKSADTMLAQLLFVRRMQDWCPKGNECQWVRVMMTMKTARACFLGLVPTVVFIRFYYISFKVYLGRRLLGLSAMTCPLSPYSHVHTKRL